MWLIFKFYFFTNDPDLTCSAWYQIEIGMIFMVLSDNYVILICKSSMFT